MRRIGIFGGTFDPVHNEHVAMAQEAVKRLRLDRLFVVPAFVPPHKSDRKIAGSSDRFIMARFAFRGVPNTEVSPAEIRAGGESYTYLTAERFAALYPGAKLYFVLGEDSFADFPTWKNPERILACAELAVVRRTGCEGARKSARNAFRAFGKPYIELPYVGKAVSATEIRVRVALGLPIDGLVPAAAAAYIADNGLYEGPEAVQKAALLMTPERREHTAGVCEYALRFADGLGLDRDKVFLAAALHDVAKNLDPADYPEFRLKEDVPAPVLHAYLGAHVAERLGVSDPEILDAVRFHTSGRANMTKLEKLLFVSDLLEKGRTFPEADKLRRAVENDFEAGFRDCLAGKMRHFRGSKQPWEIFHRTLEAYEWYWEQGKK